MRQTFLQIHDSAGGNCYCPDVAIHPGGILEEYMEAYGMTRAELAACSGLTEDVIDEIIDAGAPITADVARKLHRAFPRPAHFWLNLQRDYEDTRARLKKK